MKTRFLHVVLGILFGAAMGWLLQQGSVKIDSAIVLKWMAGLGHLLEPFMFCHHTCKQLPEQRHISLYGLVMSVFFLVLFIVPMSLTGAVQAKLYHIPAPLRNQYRISCLFTHASRTWDTAHYEVRLAGQLRWKEGPLEGFFDLDIFGYRTRFNRIVGASRYKNSRGEVYGK